MSEDGDLILEVTPAGTGLLLDLGGGTGGLHAGLTQLGYQYVNADVKVFNQNEPSVVGDAQCLPFRPNIFDVVVSKDTLEHFAEPTIVISEVRRILKPAGLFIVWVPFIHPFHGNDFYRYTPLGLRHLLHDFEILRLDSPRRLFAIFGALAAELLRRWNLNLPGVTLRSLCRRLDRVISSDQKSAAGYAAGYRLVARKRELSK